MNPDAFGEYKFGWGGFYQTIASVAQCWVVVEVGYIFSPELQRLRKKGMSYRYTPHAEDGRAHGGETTRDSRYFLAPMYGGVIAHERAHAEVFFRMTKVLFEEKIADLLSKPRLDENELRQVTKAFDEAKMESLAESGREANLREVRWHQDNGFRISREGVWDGPRKTQKAYRFDY